MYELFERVCNLISTAPDGVASLLYWVGDFSNIISYESKIAVVALLVSAYSFVRIIIYIIRRSIVRELVFNYFIDYPGNVLKCFKEVGLRDEVVALLSDSYKIRNIQSETIKNNIDEIVQSATRKIERNILRFTRFEGPVFPTYALSDANSVDYHFVLEKLKEPTFLYRVRDCILNKMLSNVGPNTIGVLRYDSSLAKYMIKKKNLNSVLTKNGGQVVYLLCRRMLSLNS